MEFCTMGSGGRAGQEQLLRGRAGEGDGSRCRVWEVEGEIPHREERHKQRQGETDRAQREVRQRKGERDRKESNWRQTD